MIEISECKEIQERDLTDFNALLGQLRSDPSEQKASLEDLKSIVEDPSVTLVVAIEGERIIGMASLYTVTKIGRHGFVEDVVVHSDYRGQGVGKKLMEKLIVLAREKGFRRLYLTTAPARVAAHGLYQSLGFQKKDTDVFRLAL